MNGVQKFIPQYAVTRLFFCGALIFVLMTASAQKKKLTVKVVDSLNFLAFKEKKYDVTAALKHLITAQNIALQISYKKGYAVATLYEGGIYQQEGFAKKALSNYYLALDVFKRSKDSFNIAKTKYQIAATLNTINKLDTALLLFNSAKNIYLHFNMQEELVNIDNGIGFIKLKQGKIDSAHHLFKKALGNSLILQYKYGEKKALYFLGMTAMANNKLQVAKYFFNRSISIDSLLKDRFGEAANLIKLAEIAKKYHQFSEALKMHLQSYKIANSINSYELIRENIQEIIAIYQVQNNITQVVVWQKIAVQQLNLFRAKENQFAEEFIEIIKTQQAIRHEVENDIIRAEKVSEEQLFLLTVTTFLLIILSTVSVLVFVYYQRQKVMGEELRIKNHQIELQIVAIQRMNVEISAQNKLLEADISTKNKLLSIISHDLRTPLVNTKGILNLVNQGIVPEDQAKQLLIQLESQYMGTTSLLDNLLFWLKGQMDGKSIEKTKVSIFQLVKGLENEHQMLFERKKVQFNNTIDPQLKIFADKEMTRIILRNLMSNAIKFTPIDGIISISAVVEDGVSILKVMDTGIGMSQATIDKINAKQYYTTAGTNMEKGSGFGLMLCSDLIKLQGGTMFISSEAGVGSTFIITLPAQNNLV